MVGRIHPHRSLEARSAFALVAYLLTPNPSGRILLQATANRSCEGVRDVVIAYTLLLARTPCTRGGAVVGEVWVENIVICFSR